MILKIKILPVSRRVWSLMEQTVFHTRFGVIETRKACYFTSQSLLWVQTGACMWKHAGLWRAHWKVRITKVVVNSCRLKRAWRNKHLSTCGCTKKNHISLTQGLILLQDANSCRGMVPLKLYACFFSKKWIWILACVCQFGVWTFVTTSYACSFASDLLGQWWKCPLFMAAFCGRLGHQKLVSSVLFIRGAWDYFCY